MPKNANRNHKHSVAPPRGERGLKSDLPELPRESRLVAPPRGERGLKFVAEGRQQFYFWSLPLVGSVD